MVQKKRIGAAGLLASGLVIAIGIVDRRVAGMIADVIPLTGIQLVIPLPNLGDSVSLLSAGGWVGWLAGFLIAAFLTIAALNLALRVAERYQSD